MSASLDIYGCLHQFALMEGLRSENRQLRLELQKHGVNPDLVIKAMCGRRKAKKRARV